jgi:hypothetical protein
MGLVFAGPERIKTVRHPTRKTLAHALSINARGCSSKVMPFALVLDDQIEPWEPTERDQVFRVPPWNHHRKNQLIWSSFGPGQVDNFESQEMQSIGNIVHEMHKAIFSCIDEKILPVLKGQNTLLHRLDIARIDEEYLHHMPESPWVSNLLPKLLKKSPLPELASFLVHQPSARPPSALIEPKDPRLRIVSYKKTPVKKPLDNASDKGLEDENDSRKRRKLDFASVPPGRTTNVPDRKAQDTAQVQGAREASPSKQASPPKETGPTKEAGAPKEAVDKSMVDGHAQKKIRPPESQLAQSTDAVPQVRKEGARLLEPAELMSVTTLNALEKLHHQYPRDRNSYNIRELPFSERNIIKIAVELGGEVEAMGKAGSYWEAKRIAALNLLRALNNVT